MDDSRRTTGGSQNTIVGGGTINAGDFVNSPVTTITGDNNTTTVNVSQPDLLMVQLRRELEEAKRLLEQCHPGGASPSRDTAIDSVDDALGVIENEKLSHDAGKLRRRLDRVISALTPFMGIIQGIASSVEIFKDIRSAI